MVAKQISKPQFSLPYLDWVPRIQDITDKIRRYHIDKSVVEPVAYFIATLLLAGLVYFIFYLDSKANMPPSPVDPDEEKDMKDSFDYESLVKKQQETDVNFILKSSTDKYNWQQGMKEIDVFIPLPDEAVCSKKAVQVIFKTGTLSVQLAGDLYINGALFDQVVPDECNWQIDTEESGDDLKIKTRTLWLSMLKKTVTQRNQFWPCLLIGDKDAGGGPPLVAVDPNDPNSMREAIKQMKASAAASAAKGKDKTV